MSCLGTVRLVAGARAPAQVGVRFRSHQPAKAKAAAPVPFAREANTTPAIIDPLTRQVHRANLVRRAKLQHASIWDKVLSWRSNELRAMRRKRASSQVTRDQLERIFKTLRRLGWRSEEKHATAVQGMLRFNAVTTQVTDESVAEVVQYLKSEASRLRIERYAKSVGCAKSRAVVRSRARGRRLIAERLAKLSKLHTQHLFSRLSSSADKWHSLGCSLNLFRAAVRRSRPNKQEGQSINDGWPPRHAILIGTIEPFNRKVYVFNRRLDSGIREPTVVVCVGDKPVIFFTKEEILAIQEKFPVILAQLFKTRKSLAEGIKSRSELAEILLKARDGGRLFLD